MEEITDLAELEARANALVVPLKSAAEYKKRYADFCTWMGQHKLDMQKDVTDKNIRLYVADRTSKWAPTTIKSNLAAIKNQLVANGIAVRAQKYKR